VRCVLNGRFMRSLSKAIGLPLVLTLGACDLVGPSATTGRASLGTEGVPIHFLVPDSVARGSEFEVEFAYRGSRFCTHLKEVRIAREGTIAWITPIVARDPGPCDDAYWEFRGRQGLRFDVPGVAEVRLVGEFAERDTTVVRQTRVR
jgi:hypothetical protein